jgi:PKD repeat protein
MFTIIKRYKGVLFTGILASLLIAGCKYDTRELGPKPVASFTITPVTGQTNRYLLTSTSTNAFRYDWDKGDGKGFVSGKATDTVYFADKGSYTIKLFAYGESGIDTTSQTLQVAADDPAALTPLKMLTNNSSRKWKLAPEVGAMWIGTSDYGTTYWQNTLADVTGRSCDFNDEFTFSKDGKLVVDTKGDFYVDMEGATVWPSDMPAPAGCYANTDIPAKYQAWTGGNFTFEVVGTNKLKLKGTGAHFGVYKAGNPPNAAITAPEAEITYDIVSLTPNRLIVKLDYGWGAWKFTYVSF